MKQKKFLAGGVLLFILLLGTDTVNYYFYYESSYQRLEKCVKNRDESKLLANDCWSAKNAADAAYSSAVRNHILTYFVIFCVFLILGYRLNKTEKRLKELEERGNF